MKIQGNPNNVVPPGPQEAQAAESARRAARLGYRNAGEAGAAAETPAAGPDQVDLSGLSRVLQSDSESRDARVSQLAADYEAGRLNPDSSQTASRLIDDAFHNE